MENEFYNCRNRNRKEKRVQTKDDVLYGIFAASSGDSDEDDDDVVCTGASSSSFSGDEDEDGDVVDSSAFGSFEKHTKGIGMKLLIKMGYKGGGLGKNEQGIAAPIQAKMRPKNMGMGFNHYSLLAHRFETHKREKPWLKQKKKKKKLYITTAEEEEEEGLEGLDDVPQVRVLTNLENLNNADEEKARENDIPMSQLQHNIRLQLENMEDIMNELDRIGEESKGGTLTLDSVLNSFLGLQQRYADDYKLCNLSSMACSYALPLFIRVFQGWDPLQDPTYGLEIVSSWKNLLQDNSDNYSQLLMEVVFPAIRISGTETWQAKDPEPMLRVLDSWEKLLPPVVLHTILDDIVLPKLSAAVDSWDPCRETIPIHYWVHPWLPLLGHKLETCYHTIGCRLESVLDAWHPSDMSAYSILSPWKTVFDPISWEKLMVRFIVPKLVAMMHKEFQVNPENQNLDQFYWVRTWATAIPIRHMLPLMDIFFNKWQQVLHHWLCSNPNFEEVNKWCSGWKELLPPELLANDHISYRLNVGFDMMNRAAKGMEVVQPGLRENISYLRAEEKRQFETEKKSGSEQLSLKELIEFYAQHNGLLFKPKPGRIHDGYQIYGFGSISIIIDSLNHKVFARTKDKWSLVSLEQLLKLHNKYSLKKRR